MNKSGEKFGIIDADAHVNPPTEMWVDYLPAEFRDKAPRIEEGDECDYIVFEGKRSPMVTLTAQAGRKTSDYKVMGKRSESRPGGWDPVARCEDMDIDGVDSAVIFGGGPLMSQDLDFHLASYDAYNRWLADFCKVAPERLFGVGYIPMIEVDDAIKAVKGIAKMGLKGVLIPAFPQSKTVVEQGAGNADSTAAGFTLTGDASGARRYCDAEFDSFWQTLTELNLPVHMHLGARKTRATPEHIMPDLLMSKLAMAEPIGVMALGGTFERHPELRFVTVESGVGWFGFVASYMDKVWHKHRQWTKNSLSQPPSFYMDRQVYGTFLEESVGIIMRNEPGCRNIMWSSDYPHSETTWPDSQKIVDKMFEGIPDEDRKRIVHDTAYSLYCS